MRSELRTALAVLATAAVLLGSATMALAADGEGVEPDPSLTTTTSSPTSPTPSATEPTPTATPSTATPSTPDPSATTPEPEPTGTTPTPEPTSGTPGIIDAELRWGINDESNNRAFAPGTFNFFSAGKIPDPGRGNVAIPQSSWKQSAGNVAIEKYLNGAWGPATWSGLRTTSAGVTMSGTNGPFSNHEIVISGGTGTVDADAGTATIQWTGSFTVLYYSGYSFFYVTDPKLTVSGGIGTLTATLSGFASSMQDGSKWEAVAPVPDVTLANLGPVDLTADRGFSVRPAYAGVAVSVPSGAPQVREGSSWGSFPQSFVDYQLTAGTGAYWYSSGGSADAHKVALPVTVSYAADAPVAVTPKPDTTATSPAVDNDAPERPTTTTPIPSASTPPLVAPAAPLAPPSGDAVTAGVGLTQFRPASTVTGVRPTPAGSDTAGIWILGVVLLGAAGLLAISPFAYSAARRSL